MTAEIASKYIFIYNNIVSFSDSYQWEVGNVLIPFKRLFREPLFQYRFQQQQNWDGRPNSSLVFAGYDMHPAPVFSGPVRYQVKESTCGPGNLKTFNTQGKRSFDKENAHRLQH